MNLTSMSRATITDFLQNFRFMLFDLPKVLEMPVLNPLFGFNSITAPEKTAETETITPGNQTGSVLTVVKNWTLSNIVMTRGASVLRTDIDAWFEKVYSGEMARRNLILVQFTSQGTGIPSIPIIGSKFTKVPAKFWLLQDCIPVRYKSASDFDASSSDISLEELEVMPNEIKSFTAQTIFAGIMKLAA